MSPTRRAATEATMGPTRRVARRPRMSPTRRAATEATDCAAAAADYVWACFSVIRALRVGQQQLQ